MPNNTINDWGIELGFDSSKVDKGLSRIEKRMAKFNKDMSGGGKSRARKVSPTNLVGEARGSTTRTGNALAAANALERKRQSMEATIRKGRTLKLDTNLAKDSVKSTDVQAIERERLALLRKIKAQEARITEERMKQARTKRTDQLTLNQRLSQEARIGRVKSEAGFAAKSLKGSDDERSVAIKKRLAAEIRRLNSAQKQLANTTFTNTKKYANLRRTINKATQNVRNLKTEIKGLKRVGGGSGGGILGSVASSFKRLGVAAISAYALIAGGQQIFETIKKLDSLKASMLAASGSAGQAKIDFEFVRESSKMLGRDLFTSAKGFQAIGAAMKGSFTEGQIKEVFLSASEASTAFGLSMEDTQGVMRAFSQIASKGTVQAEELRGQLGDRLPGAFQIAAKSMGVTTVELNKMLKAGQVTSAEFLPAFAKGLRETVKESGALAAGINTVVAAQNRMNTAFTESAERIGEAGGTEVFKDIFNIIKEVVEFLTPLGEAIVKILAPITKRLSGLISLIFEVLTPISEIVSLVVELAVMLGELVLSMTDWLTGVDQVNDGLDGTVKKMSILQAIVEVIAGFIQLIQGGIMVIKGLAENLGDTLGEVFGDEEVVKNFALKSGELVSQADAKSMADNDRIFNRFASILPFLDKIDRTGMIQSSVQRTVPAIQANITVNEATDVDAVRQGVQSGMQDALSAAMKDDQ